MDAIEQSWRDAPLEQISARARALCEHAERLTLELPQVGLEDIEALRRSGCDDEAIHDLTQVVSLFNFYNRIADVHVRGHAAIEELKVGHRLVRPQYFMGIHGEYRHLVKHRVLAIQLGVAEDDAFVLTDGDILEIDEDSAAISDEKAGSDYVYIDGLGIGDVDQILLRDRGHLATDGMVVVVAAVDRRTGKLVRPPEVMSHGFVGPDDEPKLLEGVAKLVTNELGGEGDRVDWTSIHATLKDDIAGYLHRQTHRRPLVLPVMMEV